MVAWTVATTEVHHAGALDRIVDAVLHAPNVPAMCDLANVSWALAKLQHAPAPVVERLAHGVVQRLTDLSAAAVYTLAWAFATLPSPPGSVWIDVVRQGLREVVPAVSAEPLRRRTRGPTSTARPSVFGGAADGGVGVGGLTCV